MPQYYEVGYVGHPQKASAKSNTWENLASGNMNDIK